MNGWLAWQWFNLPECLLKDYLTLLFAVYILFGSFSLLSYPFFFSYEVSSAFFHQRSLVLSSKLKLAAVKKQKTNSISWSSHLPCSSFSLLFVYTSKLLMKMYVCISLSAVWWDYPAHLITGCFPVVGSGSDVVVLASVLYSGTSVRLTGRSCT